MSIKVVSLVWEKSEQKSGALLVHLALADFADDDGTGIWPSIKKLAKKARLKERQTQYVLRHLEASREVEVEYGSGPSGVNLYRLVGAIFAPVDTGVQPDAPGGAVERTGVVQPSAPKPSFEPSVEPSSSISVWPDWYATLRTIKGFSVHLEYCRAWLASKNISEEHAETTAYALKGKWPPTKNASDPWATFQNWVKRPLLEGQRNGNNRSNTGKSPEYVQIQYDGSTTPPGA